MVVRLALAKKIEQKALPVGLRGLLIPLAAASVFLLSLAPTVVMPGGTASALFTLSTLSFAARAAEPTVAPAPLTVKPIGKIKVAISEEKVGAETYTVGTAIFPVEKERLWAMLTDYENASKTFANLSKSEVLERRDNVVTLHQIVKPGYFPFTFDYVVDLVETPTTALEWRRVSGSFNAYKGSWKLESVSPARSAASVAPVASTRVTYRVFLDANKFIPQWLMRRSLHGYLPEVFDSLRKELNRH